jgi:uncharacterized RDD family membrane protein YckC
MRMPFCKHCEAKLSEGAAYCSKCGILVESLPSTPYISKSRLELASWTERFIAWVIDAIILGIFISVIKFFVWIAWPTFVWAPDYLRWIPFVDIGMDNVIFFLYWTLMDGINGQSIGKSIMRIKVTQLNDKPVDLAHATIESLGKAFLLPLDCIIGWLLYPRKKQRLFNYISETIIVRISK